MVRPMLVAITLLGSALTACGPQPPAVPTVTPVARLVGLGSATAAFVGVDVAVAGFDADPAVSPITIESRVLDDRTGAVVEERTTQIYGARGFVTSVPVSGFAPDPAAPSGRVGVQVELTATQTVGAEVTTASGVTSATLDWTMPASPVAGTLAAHEPPNYQLTEVLDAFCGPVGRTVAVTSPDTPDTITVTQAVPGDNFSSPVTIPAGGGSVSFTTTRACVVLLVTRASFLGNLTGTAQFTVTW